MPSSRGCVAVVLEEEEEVEVEQEQEGLPGPSKTRMLYAAQKRRTMNIQKTVAPGLRARQGLRLAGPALSL